jgi:hypothetical protein
MHRPNRVTRASPVHVGDTCASAPLADQRQRRPAPGRRVAALSHRGADAGARRESMVLRRTPGARPTRQFSISLLLPGLNAYLPRRGAAGSLSARVLPGGQRPRCNPLLANCCRCATAEVHPGSPLANCTDVKVEGVMAMIRKLPVSVVVGAAIAATGASPALGAFPGENGKNRLRQRPPRRRLRCLDDEPRRERSRQSDRQVAGR